MLHCARSPSQSRFSLSSLVVVVVYAMRLKAHVVEFTIWTRSQTPPARDDNWKPIAVHNDNICIVQKPINRRRRRGPPEQH